MESAFLAFGAAEYGVWVAVLVYAYEQGGTTLAGVIAVVQLLPAAVVAPLATTVTGRFGRGAALHIGYAILAASLTLTAIVLLIKAPAPIIYIGAVIAASAVTLIRPAQSALLPDLVTEPADLTAANAITGWVENVSVLVGPALAGAMIAVDGPGAAVALLAVGTVLGTILVAPLGAAEMAPKAKPSADLEPGAVRLTDVPRLAGTNVSLLLGLVGVGFVALGALDVLEIVLAVHVLDIGPAGAGYLGAAFGAGGVLGSAATVGLIGRNDLSSSVSGAAAVTATALVVLGVWPSLAGAFLLLAAVGIGHAIVDVGGRTMLHRIVPDAVRHQVFGLQEGLNMLGLAIGSISVPPLVHAGGAEAALVAIGGVLAIVSLGVAPGLVRIERRTPAPSAKLATLRRSMLFGMLALPVLEDVARALSSRQVKAGEIVIREGDHGDEFFLVAEGEFDVSIRGAHVRTSDRLGDCFGEIALLARRRPNRDRHRSHGRRAVRTRARAIPRGPLRIGTGPSRGRGDERRAPWRDRTLGRCRR